MQMNTMTAVEFGQRLARSMVLNSVNATELERRTGIGITQISHYTKGRRLPDVRNLRKLAVALGESTDWLLDIPKMQKPKTVQAKPYA